jgi:NAD(P)-dependent dehydrogenase (short-subunit alcohol dehydrogenase family)
VSVLDLFSLEGRSVVVTGAGSGLGKAIAEATAEAGGNLVCAGRSAATDVTASEIEASGGRAVAQRADVTDEQAVEALMQRAVDEFGALDVVFCNAGSSDYFKRPHEVSLDEWEDVIATNLTSVFLCAKHAVRHMLPTRSGKLVLTASIWGEIGADSSPIPGYAAAKGGVINLTRELAVEYANDGLTVNALSPGFFSTNIGQDKKVDSAIIDRLVDGALKRVPTGRIMDPGEIKGAAVFLASQASDALNGHVLTVDGGLLAA